MGLRKDFNSQRYAARRRGIAWELTFDDWLDVWINSGRLAEKGRRKGQYVMSRRGDAGPYAIGNVFIQLCEHNSQEARRNHPEQGRVTVTRATGSGRGWTLVRGRFQVMVSRKYIGIYRTQHEAEAAYAVACAAHIQLAG